MTGCNSTSKNNNDKIAVLPLLWGVLVKGFGLETELESRLQRENALEDEL